MPGYLLHMGATVLCAHAGQASPTVTDLRVKVSGQAIVTIAAPYTIAGCTFPPPPAAIGPCVTGTWLTAALRVKASGVPVLLQDSQSLTVPPATPMSVVVTQVRVKAQ